MQDEGTKQPTSPDALPPGSGLPPALDDRHAAFPTEPATSFKWVIIAGGTVWVLGALLIVWSRFVNQ